MEFTQEQVARVPQGSRFPGSSEVLESIIGKYKIMQGERGQFGVTGIVLSIGAFVGRLTVDCIGRVLATIDGTALKDWEQTNLGATI